jgi:hypothetical protein
VASRAAFDPRALARRIDVTMAARGVDSYREVARQARIANPSLVHQLREGTKHPSPGVVMLACLWIGDTDLRPYLPADLHRLLSAQGEPVPV